MANGRLFGESASPAVLRQLRIGRGYGITLVEVMDVARVGKNGVSFHVLRADGRPLCGVRGEPREIQTDIDAPSRGGIPPPRLRLLP